MYRIDKKSKTDVFFDLDHTLWDFETNSAKAFERVFDRYKVPFSLEQFLHYYIDINEAYWERYSLNQVTQEELRLGRLKETFYQLDYEADVSTLEQYSKSYLEELPKNNYLFDGAIELLEYLKDKYALHILTNGFQEVQYKKIKNAKIETYFQTITDSEVAGEKKPHPTIFNYALHQAKVTPAESVMIGDNVIADIQGALDVGIDAIHFNPLMDKSKPSPVSQVKHLLDIKDIL